MEAPIAAVATGARPTAIGVIRLSGAGAIEAAGAVFTPADGSRFGSGAPQRLTLGTLRDAGGAPIDRVLATFSRAPHSYTGEDTAELHCHGSPAVLALALEALFAQGVRQALPGEFTRRAFLNGKLDLLQAESVADLIDASTASAVRCAAGQLGGALSRRVEEVYHGLVDLLAHFHAVLDYPDEDIDPLRESAIRDALTQARRGLESLLDSYRRGSVLTAGVPAAIVGPPNAGKSSLLNALCGFDRAIVTDTPGTTRDTVEVQCVLGDVLLRLTDTAGLRDTADPIERLGVERSREAMASAALILVVLDRTLPPTPADAALVEEAMAAAPTILVWNKADLPPSPALRLPLNSPPPAVTLSAASGEGLEELGAAIAALFPAGEGAEAPCLTNTRQLQAAREALAALASAASALDSRLPPDAVMLDVEEALGALGRLTGRSIRADTVDRIFSRFCVGK